MTRPRTGFTSRPVAARYVGGMKASLPGLLFLLVGCTPSGPSDKAGPDSGTAVTTPAGTPGGTGTTGAGSTTTPPVPSFLRFEDGEVPPNLILISIDTLRRDHLGRWGGDGRTPFLDGLIAEGVVLDDHVQCSNWTFASMSCTTLGRPGWDLGWVSEIFPDGRFPMPTAETLPSELGDQARFHSIVHSANHWFSPDWNTTSGYDRFLLGGTNADDAVGIAATAIEEAIAEGEARRHWLMHVHLMEPHAPYDPPEAYLDGLDALPPVPWDLSDYGAHYDATEAAPTLSPEEQQALEAHLRLRYAGEVAWLDAQLATAFDDLRARGLLEDALVVVYTDHGEAFWEHGNQSHAHTLNAPENDAVLFFWADTIVPAVWDGPTQAVDLAPTLLHLYGGAAPDAWEGVVLGQAPADRIRITHTQARQGAQVAAIGAGHKLVFDWSDGVTLFDTTADPAEQDDLFAVDHPAVQALWPTVRAATEAMDAASRRSPDWPEGL